jgi:predicted CXXCH cytochrome family protein
MTAVTGVRVLAVVVCLTIVAPPAWARGTAGSGLAGSSHDFSKLGNSLNQSDRNASMCIFCHVPRGGSDTVGGPLGDRRLPISAATAKAGEPMDDFNIPPLWSHEVTAGTASYSMYQNGSGAPQRGAKASQAIANGQTLGSTSLLCLGCHDGSVAANWYGNNSQLSRFSPIGKDNSLANHHPVGFDYDAVQSMDKEIRSADIAYLTATGTVRDHLYGPGKARMECGTCHSVHNTGNSGESLLWRSDVRSNLCLTCHDKGIYTPPGYSSAMQAEGDVRAGLGN